MSKIARITSDKKLLLSNEIIEGDKISLNADGTLYVNEIIEGDKFSINSNGIEVVELVEDYILEPLPDDPYLDFVFGEVMREDMGGRVRRTYETNEVIVNHNCTLFFDESDTPSVSFYWVKNGSELRAYNMDVTTWENSSITLSEGDKLKFQFTTLAQPEDSTTGVLDIDLKLSNEVNPIVSNLYCVYSGSTCYLTTAMVGYFNKADDGIELTAMRELRSHSGYKYQDVLEEYSHMSPIIIKGIEQSEDKDYYYNMIKDVVDNIVIWVASEEWEKAEIAYLNLYYELKEKFGGD